MCYYANAKVHSLMRYFMMQILALLDTKKGKNKSITYRFKHFNWKLLIAHLSTVIISIFLRTFLKIFYKWYTMNPVNNFR
jgi:hypothetical protein